MTSLLLNDSEGTAVSHSIDSACVVDYTVFSFFFLSGSFYSKTDSEHAVKPMSVPPNVTAVREFALSMQNELTVWCVSMCVHNGSCKQELRGC